MVTLGPAHVRWTDIWSLDDWSELEELDVEALIVDSYGILVLADDNRLVLAMSRIDGTDEFGTFLVIPRRNVISITDLEPRSE